MNGSERVPWKSGRYSDVHFFNLDVALIWMVFKFLGKQRRYSQCFEAFVFKTTEESLLYVAGMIIVIYGLHTKVLCITVFLHELCLSDFLKILELAI